MLSQTICTMYSPNHGKQLENDQILLSDSRKGILPQSYSHSSSERGTAVSYDASQARKEQAQAGVNHMADKISEPYEDPSPHNACLPPSIS